MKRITLLFLSIFFVSNAFYSNSQCTGNYYVVDVNPWGNTFGITAMDDVFGAGNWTQSNFSGSAAAIFDPSICFVMLEGSDGNAIALDNFLTANMALIESWVNAGGRLFINAAPNQGVNINLGFGGTTLVYPTYSSTATAVNALDPIFLGPNLPTATSYTGSSYSHASITGSGLTLLLTGDVGETILANKTWGSGIVFFGGITQPNFHTPTTEAINLWYNIFHYTNDFQLCAAPDVPTLSASTNDFCPGNNVAVGLSITAGNLNDAAEWYWYTGSCGGTLVGFGTSINVNVNATTTYYVRGEVGCTGVCAEIIVGDTEAPTLTAPADVTVNVDAGACEATGVAIGNANSTDNCGATILSNDAPTVFPVGLTVITWTSVDNSGNVSTATQEVMVVDPNGPSITCPFVSLAVNAIDGLCGAPVVYAEPIAEGNCNGGFPELTDVLSGFDANQANVLATIPSPFLFAMDGGVNGNNIGDGGNDMYDGGNYINTNFASQFFYSDGVILPSTNFGTTGEYFTRYVSNGTSAMFVLAADLDAVSSFSISGNNGADGSGTADQSSLSVNVGGIDYDVFIKRVYNAFDPSINQVMIIPSNANAVHTVDLYTDNDANDLSVIDASERLYYLLYAGNGGFYIDDASTQIIVEEFLNSIVGSGVVVAQTDASGLTSGDTFPHGVTVQEYTATDLSGNTATCSFTIEVISLTQSNAVITDETSANNGAIDITLAGGSFPYSFAWTGPNGFTSTSEDISGLEGGTYVLTTTGNDGCETTFTYEVNSVLGVSTSMLESFKLYPNPTSNVVNIEVVSNGELQLLNANGQLLSTQTVEMGTFVMDVRHLETGMYTVRFTNESGVAIKKLVVNN